MDDLSKNYKNAKKIAVLYLLTKGIEVFPREYQIRLQ